MPSAAFEKQLSVALPKWGDGAIEVKLGLSTVKLKPVSAREGSKLEHDGAYAVFAEQFTSKRRLLQRADWRPHGPPGGGSNTIGGEGGGGVQPPTGCGCTSTSFAPLLMLGGLWRGRTRRRHVIPAALV